MSSLTDYEADNLVDRYGGAGVGSGYYLALIDDGGIEVSGGSYARLELSLPVAAARTTANTDPVSFADLPAVIVQSAAVFDDVSAGNKVMQEDLPAPVTILAGGTLDFPAGTLTITAP